MEKGSTLRPTRRMQEKGLNELLHLIEETRDTDRIKRYLREWLDYFDSEDALFHGPGARAIGHRHYDQLITDIFSAVVRATSREVLLNQVLDGLASIDGAVSADALFIIKGDPILNEPGQLWLEGDGYRIVKPERWANFQNDVLPNLTSSQFLLTIFSKKSSYDQYFTHFIPDYNGEFDTLLGKASLNRRAGYWINAASLPSNQPGQATRAVFALYSNRGDEYSPKVTAQAGQDWRVLHFLKLAYEVLTHQLINVAEQVRAQRSILLTELAPGIFHHEVGIHTSVISNILSVQYDIVKDLVNEMPSAHEKQLIDTCDLLRDACNGLLRISDAFNNLERRRSEEKISLGKIIEESLILTKHRLGRCGAGIIWQSDSANIEIFTDSALLLHVFLNIIVNATNSFLDQKNKYENVEPSMNVNDNEIIISCSEDPLRTPSIIVDIINNGPEIPKKISEKIFEKGFTTRKDGHGQGLYICRLIAQTLGGELELISQHQLPPEVNVGFRLSLPKLMPRGTDLMGEAFNVR